MTKILSYFRAATLPLFKTEHLGNILDTLDRAAVLVDDNGHVIAVNRQTAELTAFTRAELATFHIDQIIPRASHLLIGQASAPHSTLPRLSLTTRSQQEISVAISIQPLGENLPWHLITLERAMLREKKKASEKFTFRLLNRYFPELIAATQEADPDIALQNILATGFHLLGECSLALYIGQGHNPSMRLVASQGENIEVFPTEMTSSEIGLLMRPALWQKGERGAGTILHGRVRQTGLVYLASSPIVAEEEPRAWLGLIAAIGNTPPPDFILPLLKILAAFAGTIIHNNVLAANLRKSLHETSYRLSTWKNASENIHDGVISVSPQIEITSMNTAAEMIFGYAEKEVLGTPIGSVLIGSDRLFPAVENALQGTATPNLGNTTLHRRNGESFPVDLAVTPIVINQNITGALMIVRDLSEHEQIRIRSQQLEQRALLGEVTAVFAHEVRNPINNISLGLQLLDRQTEDDDPNKDRIQHMLEDCERLTSLMDSVLTFSRTGTYTFAGLDVHALLDRIITRWRPRLANANIQCNLQASTRRSEVFGDKRSLEQVFTNLISNAVQAMGDQGNGTLNIKISNAQAPSGKEIIQIDFADNGPGISIEHQTKIFDPFYTTNPHGTGLGLSITKQIITAHRGNITLTSFPGATVFHIQLPTAAFTEKGTP